MIDAEFWQSGYAPVVPFSIQLPSGTLVCEQCVRAMPGRRYVFRGCWQLADKPQQAVFIKLFATSSRGRREWLNEQAGIESLNIATVLAPTILAVDTLTEPALHLIVYAQIANAENARDRWQHSDDDERRILMRDLVKVLAAHHNAGLIQQDLHLANFICQGEKVYTLDAGDITQSSMNENLILTNLAGFFALHYARYDEWLEELYGIYTGFRHKTPDQDEYRKLAALVINQRRYKLKKYLKKIYRSCSAFIARSSWWQYCVYDRREDNPVFSTYCDNPDQLPADAQQTILKDGNTCLVTRFILADKELVCKRYNIKNSWHALRRGLRETRASQSWRNAHRLLRCGIATPIPLALIEKRFGPIRRQAWFVMQAVDGPRVYEYFRDKSVSQTQQLTIARQMAEFIKLMQAEKLSHGDMKATNFIINDQQLYVIDLDAMQVHGQEKTHTRALQKDVARFMRNWQSLPAVEAMFHQVFVDNGLADFLATNPAS